MLPRLRLSPPKRPFSISIAEKIEGGRRGGNGKSAGTPADHANLRPEFSIILRHQPAELTAIETNLAEGYFALAHDAEFLMAC